MVAKNSLVKSFNFLFMLLLFLSIFFLSLPFVAAQGEVPEDIFAASPSPSSAVGGIVAVSILFVVVWIIFIIAIFVLAIGLLLLWIFMLVDALKRKDWKDDTERIIWILIVVLLGGIGAAIYYFAIRHHRGAAY